MSSFRVYKNKTGRLVLPRSNMMTGTFGAVNRIDPNWVIVPGTVSVGEGLEGKVTAGFVNANMKNLVAIKNFFDANLDFQPDEYFAKSLSKFIPEHVPNVRSYKNGRMISNMYRGGSALDWFAANKNELDDNFMRSFILQVVGSLHRVSLLNPSFRHNDLHLGNVFIDDRYFLPKAEVLYKYKVPYYDVRAIIADFGYAADKVHPLTFDREVVDYGIVRGNDKMYDTHFFLSALLSALKRLNTNTPATVAFLERAVPVGYRGKDSAHIENFRLRVGEKYPKTFDDILGDRYFKDHLKAGKPSVTKRLNLAGPSKKKPRSPPPAKRNSPRVAFSRANKERVALRKIELMRSGNLNNVGAEMKAIRNIETLKKAGLLTPSPTVPKVIKPLALGPAVARPGPSAAEVNKQKLNEFVKRMNVAVVRRPELKPAASAKKTTNFTRSPGGRIRIGGRLCTGYKKDALVEMARKAGVLTTGTKDALCKRLISGKGPARSPARSPASARRSPVANGRFRIGGKLCMSYTKDQLIGMARRAGVSAAGTKQQLCDRLRD